MSTGIGKISSKHKVMLDDLKDALDLERAQVLQVALAKGIAERSSKEVKNKEENREGSWQFQWSVIDSENFLLFKHLLIMQAGSALTDEEIKREMQKLIENGIEAMVLIKEQRTSLDELRFAIL